MALAVPSALWPVAGALCTRGLGSREVILCGPHDRSSHQRLPPLHTHAPAPHGPTESEPHSSAPLPAVRFSSASSSSRDVLPRDCWCDGGPGHPHPCPKVPAGPHCTGLHTVRTAQTGPTLIATTPLTGAISHLLSTLISAHLVFH